MQRPAKAARLDAHDGVGLRVEIVGAAERLRRDGVALEAARLARDRALDDEAQKRDEARRIAEGLAPDDAHPMGGQVQLPGHHMLEPTFGLPATWIDGGLRDQAQLRGYTVVDAAFEEAARLGEMPVLVTSAQSRPFVRSIIERFRRETPVLSQGEIHPRVRLKTVGSV